ncbi:ribosomal L22e protein [Dictyocaulus viviparus]|uniref:Large ribosomal subunit protein eL22 n=1 Tax=Dictyocaulus viviparus TaxID=29172 RepID=A0A0D8XZH0_DICVI|nr:ribosomal L22e protein [Dictyocaulus viviparus]
MVALKPSSKSTRSVKGSKKNIRKKKVHLKFNIECKNPAEDGIFKTEDFETFLNEKIKIGGKCGQLANSGVKVELNKTKVSVIADIPFSKRYLKYLTKKYLKKHSLRDWLRIVAINKNTYELRYFHINQDEDEGSDND